MTASDQVHLRPLRDEDLALVYSSWLHDHERSAMTLFADPNNERYVSVGCPRDAYFAAQKRLIAGILARPNVRVLVACDAEDHDQVFGWACWETVQGVPVVHYVFTKRPFRRMGVARRLWNVINPDDVEVVATHAGSASHALRQAGVRFRTKPFLALLSALDAEAA